MPNEPLSAQEQRAIRAAMARDRRRAERDAEIDAFLAGVREEFPELGRAMDAPALGPLKWTPEIDHDAPEGKVRD